MAGYVQSTLNGGADDHYTEHGRGEVCDGLAEGVMQGFQHALRVMKRIPNRRHSLSRGQDSLGRNADEP